MAYDPCAPCECIPGSVDAFSFHQAALIILCNILTTLEEAVVIGGTLVEANPTIPNATSTILLPANPDRRYLEIHNNTSTPVMISLSGLILTGSEPSPTNIGVLLQAGEEWKSSAWFVPTSEITVYQATGASTNLIYVAEA